MSKKTSKVVTLIFEQALSAGRLSKWAESNLYCSIEAVWGFFSSEK